MKYPPILVSIMLIIVSSSHAQTKISVLPDSVRVNNGELVIRNGSRTVPGFLYNKGNGVTEFKRPLTKVNDTLYLVGIDSLKIKSSSAASNFTVQSLTDGSTVTWDLSSGINGGVTLAGTNRTMAFTNPTVGQRYKLKVTQDGTGNRTVGTWPSTVKWSGGIPPILSTDPGVVDLFDFFYDGTNYFGSVVLNYKSAPAVAIVKSDTASGFNKTLVHALTAVPNNSLLVVCTTQDGYAANATITATGLTWTKRVDVAGAAAGGSGDDVEIWTAPVTTGGSITVNVDWAANGSTSSAIYVLSNAEPTLSGASNTATGQTSPSVALTTTRGNSIIFAATADFNTIDGSTRTYRDGATGRGYYRDGNYTTYFYYKQATSIGSYTEGISAPTGQNSNTAVLEIRGN